MIKPGCFPSLIVLLSGSSELACVNWKLYFTCPPNLAPWNSACLLILFFSGVPAKKDFTTSRVIARCYGYSPCNACSNCSACKHCNVGSTCRVCVKVKSKSNTPNSNFPVVKQQRPLQGSARPLLKKVPAVPATLVLVVIVGSMGDKDKWIFNRLALRSLPTSWLYELGFITRKEFFILAYEAWIFISQL